MPVTTTIEVWRGQVTLDQHGYGDAQLEGQGWQVQKVAGDDGAGATSVTVTATRTVSERTAAHA